MLLKLDLLPQDQETICEEPSRWSRSHSAPPRPQLTSMDPVGESALFTLVIEAYFLVSKDTPALMSLRSMDRWDHYVQKPPALFGLSRWWNIDGKIEIFCLLLSIAHLKGLMRVKTFPVSCYVSQQHPLTSTGAESRGSVELKRIDELLKGGFSYTPVVAGFYLFIYLFCPPHWDQ